MKILWQAYDRAGYTGGPIVNTVRLLPELQRLGYEILAIIGHDGTGHPNADRLEALGIKCYTYQWPRYSEDHVKIFLKVIIDFKPHVFVSNVSAQAAFAGSWARAWGIPVVHTHRSDDELNNGMAQFFFAGPEKWRLSALVCVNQFLLDKIQSLNKKPFTIRVIPSGVSVPPYISNQDNASKLKVVYAGRLVQKQKRVKDIVNAFIALAKLREDFVFTLIGNGEEQFINELKEEIFNQRLTDRIKFIGRLEGDDYKIELSRHHAIVLLSDYEGTPGVLMDGMSCGLVPVALNIHGMDELIKNNLNGILVEDRDKSFIDALILIAENLAFRKKLSENARWTIIEHFSLERTVTLWDELFQEIISQSSKSGIVKMPWKIKLPKETNLLPEHRSKPGLRKKALLKLRKIKKLFKIE